MMKGYIYIKPAFRDTGSIIRIPDILSDNISIRPSVNKRGGYQIVIEKNATAECTLLCIFLKLLFDVYTAPPENIIRFGPIDLDNFLMMDNLNDLKLYLEVNRLSYSDEYVYLLGGNDT